MAAFSNYFENKIVDWLNGTQLPAPTSSLYLALFSSSFSEANPTTGELTTTLTGSASRVEVSMWTVVAASASTDATISNTNDIIITNNAAASATATNFGVFDAATSGNLLFHGALASTVNIAATDTVKFAAGAITLTVQ